MSTLSGHDPEGEAYLAAIYGGREITAGLAAKVAELRENLTGVDPYVNVGADFEYAPRTGILKVVRDDRVVDSYVIPVHEGYWGQPIGYRVRNRGSIAVMLDKAEAMMSWPIYRTWASLLGERERTLLLTALENARESLEYAVDNDHYASDGEGDDLRANLLAGWTELEARLS